MVAHHQADRGRDAPESLATIRLTMTTSGVKGVTRIKAPVLGQPACGAPACGAPPSSRPGRRLPAGWNETLSDETSTPTHRCTTPPNLSPARRLETGGPPAH